jgi:RimJ/RimL family protein N-acetyltransferase
MHFTLADGTAIRVRPIRPADKAALSQALGRLSELSVHRRFLSAKTRFSESELRYLTEVDMNAHVALVAEEAGHPSEIVAVARYVALDEEPGTAEAAIVVGDHLQGKGLGTILADLVAREAVRHGITRFTATMLSDNRAAQRLMARLTDHLERRHDGAHQELVAELAA